MATVATYSGGARQRATWRHTSFRWAKAELVSGTVTSVVSPRSAIKDGMSSFDSTQQQQLRRYERSSQEALLEFRSISPSTFNRRCKKENRAGGPPFPSDKQLTSETPAPSLLHHPSLFPATVRRSKSSRGLHVSTYSRWRPVATYSGGCIGNGDMAATPLSVGLRSGACQRQRLRPSFSSPFGDTKDGNVLPLTRRNSSSFGRYDRSSQRRCGSSDRSRPRRSIGGAKKRNRAGGITFPSDSSDEVAQQRLKMAEHLGGVLTLGSASELQPVTFSLTLSVSGDVSTEQEQSRPHTFRHTSRWRRWRRTPGGARATGDMAAHLLCRWAEAELVQRHGHVRRFFLPLIRRSRMACPSFDSTHSNSIRRYGMASGELGMNGDGRPLPVDGFLSFAE
nr:hypothetical protein Iba_chr13eCG9450 [Ipomoea batatas]